MHVGNLPYQRLGGGDRQELHEIDLVRIDIEGEIGPELEIGPEALALLRQMRHRRQQLLIETLGQVRRWDIAQVSPHLIYPRPRLDAIAGTEKTRESRMRNGYMESVGVVIADVLPVDAAGPQSHPALRHELLEPIGLELIHIGRRHLADARKRRHVVRGALLEAHEHESHEHFLLERHQSVALAIESLEVIALRHREEAPVQTVCPGVIGAGDPPAAVSPGLIEEPGGAVTAGVVKAANLSVIAAQHDDALAEEIEGMVVAAARHVVEVTDDLPARPEDELLLHLEEFRVAVDPGRQADRIVVGGGDDIDRTGAHETRPRSVCY